MPTDCRFKLLRARNSHLSRMIAQHEGGIVEGLADAIKPEHAAVS
jgi:hypothetical protein